MTTVTNTEPNIQAGETLRSSSTTYSILGLIGEGVFGHVAKCKNLQTGEAVAIKVLKKDSDSIQDAEHEVSILKTISVLNPDSINIVKFFEQFDYMERSCLAFEMLEANLYNLLEHNDWDPMSLRGIRPIAKQLFVALAALKTLGILHTDIKPDNIMIVKEHEEAVRVKLIDFGLAIPANKVTLGMEIQPTGYRAPEVALGLPFTVAIDVWGVGCILGFLFLAEHLFPVLCDHRMMKRMVELLGFPANHLLWNGGYTQYFFTLDEAQNWRLQTPEEYALKNGARPQESDTSYILPTSLDDMMDVYPMVVSGETEDTGAFVDLMKGLLRLDGSQRLTPHQALQHPFISMTHLSQDDDLSDYFNQSQLKMSNCQDTGLVTGHDEDSDSWHSRSLGEATDGQAFENEIPSHSQWVDDSWFPNGQGSDTSDGFAQSWNRDESQSHQSHAEMPAESWSLNEDHESHEDSDSWSFLSLGETRDDQTFENEILSLSQCGDLWFPAGQQSQASFNEFAQSWNCDERQSHQSHAEMPAESWSLNEDHESREEDAAPADSAAVTNTSSGGLKKRLTTFFKSLKRRALRSFCCIRPAED